jgi:hypothetical protein
MNLPDDIAAKAARDFPDAVDRAFVLGKLSSLEVNEKHRIMRCILFCAAGDKGRFCEMEQLARVDYRDVIMCAEYEPGTDRRVRSFIEPIPF